MNQYFVFVKRRTAYEMRISDWSSDVCSSDLVACNRRYLDLLGFPHDMGRPGTSAEAFFRHNALRGEYGPGDIEDLVRERMDLAREFQAHHKIGRASSRERVGQ